MLNVQYRTVRSEWHNGGVTLNVTLNAIIQTLLTTSGATSKSMAGAQNHCGNKVWSMQELLRPKKYHHCRYWV